MKYLYIVLFLLSCTTAEKEPILNILIKYVDFETSRIIKIDCKKFDAIYTNQISITDTDNLNKFIRIKQNIKLNQIELDPDVRAKVFVNYNDKIDVFCLGNNAQTLNGISVYFNHDLDDFVKESIRMVEK